MLRQLLLAATLLFSVHTFAAWDFFQTYIILDQGDGNSYYAGGFNSDSGTSYAGRHLGFFNVNDTFILNGGEMKTFKNGGSDVCGGEVYYRIYKECETPPATFNSVSFNFAENLPSAGDQRWDATTANIDLLAGLSKGDYVLEVFWRVFGSDAGGCGQEKFDSNFGNNFTATFTVGADGFSDGDFTASPVWSGDTGSYSVLEASTLSGDGANSNIGSGTNDNRDVLVSNASTGEAAITTPSTQAYGVWEFSVATGNNWNTSDSNNFGIILTSDTDDASLLKIGAAMDFNGYYIKLKNGVAEDKFVLVKQQGMTETEILDLNYPLTPNVNDGYTLKVIRTTDGEWEVYADQGFDGTDATTLRGTVRDNDITTSSYFAVSTNITNASDARRLYFDNLLFGAGTEVTFDASSATIIEEDGAQTYDITVDISDVDDRCATTADVVLISGDGTKVSGFTSQTLTWAAGDASSQTVSLTIATNDACETDQIIGFALQNVSGGCEAKSAGNETFALTIEDDESGTIVELEDDIEDGDITDWTTGGLWTAQNSVATINGTFDLKHDNTGAVNDYASRDLDNLELRGVETRWRFNLKHGGFSTSSNNWVMMVLAGSEADAWSADLDGYAIGVNFNTAADELRLVRIDDGVYTDLITSTQVIDANDIWGIEVVRDEDGNWSFGYQNGGGWDSLTDAGSTVQDNQYVVANNFSFAVELTSGNAGKPRIDDIQIQQYGCDETWYSVATGNSNDAIWSEDPAGTGENLTFGKFKRLIIQAPDVVTLNGDIIARDFSTIGEVDGANFDVAVYGNIVNDGTFTANNGSLTLRGEGAQIILGSNDLNVNNLVIDNDGNTITTNVNINVKGIVSPEEGTLDLNGNDLTLLSDATATAGIGEFKTGASIVGDVTMQRYLPVSDQDWVNLGSPLTGLTIADWADDFVTTGFAGSDFPDYPFNNIQKYDETVLGDLNDGWEQTAAQTDALTTDRGYMVFMTGASNTVDAKGGLQTGSVNVPVTFSPNMGTMTDGWNLITNPYPSAIDWDALVALSTNVSTYYVFDTEIDGYISRNGNTGVGAASQFIASGQSVWVKADMAGASLQFEESIKVPGVNSFERSTPTTPVIEFSLTSGERTDRAFVGSFSGATAAYDSQSDALDLRSMHQNAARLSIASDDLLLEHNMVNSFNENSSHVLRFTAYEQAGTWTLSADDMSNIPTSACITIEDTFDNSIVALEEGMTWTVDLAAEEVQDRFILHIGGAATIEAEAVSCYGSEDGTATLNLPEGTYSVQWVDEMEQTIATMDNVSGEQSIQDLGFGNYTAFITDENGVCTSLFETVYVDTPSQHELSTNQNLAFCGELGAGWIEFQTNAEAMDIVLTNDNNDVVYEGNSPAHFFIEELNAEAYTASVSTGCETWEVAFDLTDDNAITLEVEEPSAAPVLNGQGVIVINAEVEGNATIEWLYDGMVVGTEETLEFAVNQAGEYEFTVIASNETCSQELVVIAQADEVVGIEEIQNDVDVVFNGQALGLKLPGIDGQVMLKVFSTNGQLVNELTVQAQASRQWIVLNDLATGAYTVQLVNNNQVIAVEKFVK